MRVIVVENYEEMSKKAALMIASQLYLNPKSVLGLATGSTPVGMYEELIRLYESGEIDFSQAMSFNLDEYYGISKDKKQSYHSFMKETFFDHINIPEDKRFIPDGLAEDVENECRNYDKSIIEMGGIDIQVLGIGVNGHIGFNEPNINFEAKTHLVNLDEQTIKDNARFFDSIDEVPRQAISMGMKTIMQSKKIVLLASGKNKADAIQKTIEGKITSDLPASLLQIHKDVVIIVDKEAGEKLSRRDI
ncbi:MAG: glucosamine-6-phosphate deaminase [Tissierellales bacterium]|jgi:glucosamine-6-phosphate deaminase|nr:glucosamine-6-phosphate deaminase [Tissierellales bacterium]